MRRPPAHRTTTMRLLAVGVVLAALAACSDPEPDDPEPTVPATSSAPQSPTEAPTQAPTEPASSLAVAELRATLGALDPCDLLAPPDGDGRRTGATARYAEGPHTCEGQLGDVRVRVEVGVPFDEVSRESAEPREIAGLAAYDQLERCRVVFPAGADHGIAVEADSKCQGATEASAIVGAALATDVDAALRRAGPDAHTACGLMADAVADPTMLVDAVGDMSEGLDHCRDATGVALSGTAIRLGYTTSPFDEMARLTGEIVSVNGQDAVLNSGGDGTCYLHLYLWPTTVRGDDVNTEAVISDSTCREARAVAGAVVTAAGRRPASPGSVPDLLTHSG